MTRQYFRIELVYLNEIQDNYLEPVRQSGVCNSPYLLLQSSWKDVLLEPLSIEMDISTVNSGSGTDIQIFKKLWNYDVMATGLACVDVV